MSVLGLGHTEPATACPECGAPPPADARFCGACGARLKRAPRPSDPQVLLPRVTDTDRPPRSRRWVGVVALAAVVLAAVASVVIARGGAPSIVADEGRTPRGPGSTGVTSATSALPTRVAWRWTGEDDPSDANLRIFPTIYAARQVGDLVVLDVEGEHLVIDAATGAVRWRSPWFGLDAGDGELHYLDGRELLRLEATTGRVLERTPLAPDIQPSVGHATSVSGVALVQGGHGVQAVDSRTGELRWSVEDAWLGRHGTGVALLVGEIDRPTQRLLAIDVSSGDQLWSEPFDFATDVLIEDTLIQGLDRAQLAARDVRTGDVLWTFEGTTLGHDPLPAGPGRIAIWTLADTTTLAARLLILDLDSGRELERIELPEAGRSSLRVTPHGVLARDGVELFLWRDGQRVWSVETPLDDLGDEQAPVVTDDLVLHGAEDAIVARDLTTGLERWRIPVQRPRWWNGTAVTAGDDLVIAGSRYDGPATALDRHTGLRLWTAPELQLLAGTDDGVVAIRDTAVQVADLDGERRWETPTDAYYFEASVVGDHLAVRGGSLQTDREERAGASSSVQLLTLQDGVQTAHLDERGVAVTAVLDGTIYLEQLDRGDLVRVDLEAAGPVERWRRDAVFRGNVMASDDHVVLSGPSGATVLDAATGGTLHELEFERLDLGAASLAGTRLLIGDGDRAVEAWDVVTGQRKWHTELGGSVSRGISVAGEHALVPDATGHLNTLRVDDGTLVGRIDLGGRAAAPPVASDGYVYVVLEDGGVVALR